MKFQNEFNTLIILGSWNHSIFNPDWVKQYLFPDEELNIEFPIEPITSIRYSLKRFKFNVQGNRLTFMVVDTSDAVFDEIGNLARKITTYLSHTPIQGFGINFLFDDPDSIGFFERGNYRILDKEVGEIASSSLTQTINCDKHKLNFTITEKPDMVTYSFNYHYNVKSIKDFLVLFQEETLNKFKNKSLELLSEQYELNLDEDGK